MNHFTYEEMFVGQTVEFKREITDGMMESFCEISGDINPLHKDEDFAKEKGYPGRVVYGMLTSAMYSCLGGHAGRELSIAKCPCRFSKSGLHR